MKKFLALLLSLTMICTAAIALADSIYVVSREDGSGTRSAFVELTGVETKNEAGEKIDNTTVEAAIYSGTSEVKTTVAGDELAIGYISLGSMDDTVKAVKVEGVEATAQNVADGVYALARPFNIAYKADTLSDTAKDFIAWIMSEEGQTIVTENKYVAAEPVAYEAAPVAGKIVVGGSSSVSPLMEKLAEAYMAKNPDVVIELQTNDSSTGMKEAAAGNFDIGMASRAVKDSELEQGLTPATICMDGIAVIVNLNNPVDDLTLEQIRSIYVGETTDWTEVAAQ